MPALPAIARWTSIDPVVHHSMSPFNAFDNNPVFWADPSGADVEQINGGVRFTGQDAIEAFGIIQNHFKGKEDESERDHEEDRTCEKCPDKIDFTKGQKEILKRSLVWAIYINALPEESDLRVQDIFENKPKKNKEEEIGWWFGREKVSGSTGKITVDGFAEEYAVASVSRLIYSENPRIAWASINTLNAKSGIEFFTEPQKISIGSSRKQKRVAFSIEFFPSYRSKLFTFIQNNIFNDRSRVYNKLGIQQIFEQGEIKD